MGHSARSRGPDGTVGLMKTQVTARGLHFGCLPGGLNAARVDASAGPFLDGKPNEQHGSSFDVRPGRRHARADALQDHAVEERCERPSGRLDVQTAGNSPAATPSWRTTVATVAIRSRRWATMSRISGLRDAAAQASARNAGTPGASIVYRYQPAIARPILVRMSRPIGCPGARRRSPPCSPRGCTRG